MANRLIGETSPYLRQHANNPVDWYPWGEEAFARAKREDKPVLLSIGYSACHWCHVMERESFMDIDTSRTMNEMFVNIKIDREERPDIDSIYIEAVQAMTGGGGWPLTAFLLPDGRPFYGGTYFPPRDAPGLPSFQHVLLAVADAYHQRKTDVARIGQEVMTHIAPRSASPVTEEPGEAVLTSACHGLKDIFDYENSGFGGAPKFPQPSALELLLRCHYRSGDARSLHLVEQTLEKMSSGGIFDQIGGGFHRYTTDARWLVPHFEKMLYDNALLSRLYLHAFQVTGKPRYRHVAERTLDWALREMSLPGGAFASSLDADSEGEEGRYYVWDHQEARDILGDRLGEIACRRFGITESGNFDGRNILYVATNAETVAEEVGLGIAEVEEAIQNAVAGLMAARRRREPPARDNKVITSWNGLMIQSLACGAGVLGRQDYRHAATEAASFLLHRMRMGGRLMHSGVDGRAKVSAFLEDYALLAEGLLAVQAVSPERRWIDEARALTDSIIELFWDGNEEMFTDTGPEHERLLIRPQRLHDSPLPSGGAATVQLLLGMATLTGNGHYREIATSAMRRMTSPISNSPAAFPAWACSVDFLLSRPLEVMVLGSAADPGTWTLLKTVHRRYLPYAVVLALEPCQVREPDSVPLLDGRTLAGGRPTAFVCRGHTCQAPVIEAGDLEVLLSSQQTGWHSGEASPST